MKSKSTKKLNGNVRMDLAGKRFGKLIAVKFVYLKNHRAYWLYKCDCGNEIILAASKVTFRKNTSCGCGEYENRLKNCMSRTKHGFYTPNRTLQRKFYECWGSFKSRCLNKNDKDYSRYGGRGIKVCDEWLEFENFRDDMWEGFLKHVTEFGKGNTTLDRKDVNGNYEPSNCRWATYKKQNCNRCNNIVSKNPKSHMRIHQRLQDVLKCILIKKVKTRKYKNFFGCSPEELRKHIESQFTDGMTWGNHGKGKDKWNFEHIIPCYKFDLTIEKDRKECYHYTNLRPMWQNDNLKRRIDEKTLDK
jgi:hypothetical protein